MDCRLEAVTFINSVRCRRPWDIFCGVTSRGTLAPGPISLSNVAADGGLGGSIMVKGDVPVASCDCMLYEQASGCTYVSQSFRSSESKWRNITTNVLLWSSTSPFVGGLYVVVVNFLAHRKSSTLSRNCWKNEDQFWWIHNLVYRTGVFNCRGILLKNPSM